MHQEAHAGSLLIVLSHLNNMTYYHLDLGDARIRKLYPRQGVQVQFIPRRGRNRRYGLDGVTAMPDLLQRLDRIRNPHQNGDVKTGPGTEPDVIQSNGGSHIRWLDFFFLSTWSR